MANNNLFLKDSNVRYKNCSCCPYGLVVGNVSHCSIDKKYRKINNQLEPCQHFAKLQK